MPASAGNDQRHLAGTKMLNSTEDAHTKSMSTFETDEHLRPDNVRVETLNHLQGVDPLSKKC